MFCLKRHKPFTRLHIGRFVEYNTIEIFCKISVKVINQHNDMRSRRNYNITKSKVKCISNLQKISNIGHI